MNLRKQNLTMLFVLMFSFVLALTVVSIFHSNPVEAGAQAQGRNDVKSVGKSKGLRLLGAQLPLATNDNCANAISINACPFTDSKDTTGGGDETGEPASTCSTQANSVWYTLPASVTRRIVTVSTCASNFDTAIMVYRETGGACVFSGFVPVACNDDFNCGDGLQSQVEFTADAGQTYKIQAGGFDGDTGNLTVNVTCQDLICDDIVINGALGLGSPDRASVSGQQTPARLFRDGVPSTCGAPKGCPGPFGSGSFTFDSYLFTNESATAQCVRVAYQPNVGCNVNAHAIVYLNSFNSTNLCLNYLADVGSSDDLTFSFTVPAGTNFVVVIAANNPGGVGNGCAYKFTVIGNICQPCAITCPANITVSNDPNQCGAVVSYPAPTTTGNCGTVTCSPASGSFFPKGTTTVTCTTSDGPSCSFTVTVNDTQPPTITCPANVTVTTPTVTNPCAVANFTTVATDNCPGVTVACNPPSGSCFPVGTTTVTCTATDASGNTATCSFTVSVFNVCLQDDSNPSIVFLGNTVTGQYRFCCNGQIFTGVAQVITRGLVSTFQHTAPDRRVQASFDGAVFKGTASIQSPPGTIKCTIMDRDTRNNTCVCQ